MKSNSELDFMVYRPTDLDEPEDYADHPDIQLAIKMFYVGEHINFQGMVQEYPYAQVPLSSRALNRDCLIIILSALDTAPLVPNDPGRYVVVFQYGSVVCFNLSDKEIQETLEIARRYATGVYESDSTQSDDYTVVIRPSLKEWSIFEDDCVVLRRLNVNNLRVISSVLGQTVALYHYELQVDKMLDLFGDLNTKTESTGKFSMTKRRLFQLVRSSYTNLVPITESDSLACHKYVTLYEHNTAGGPSQQTDGRHLHQARALKTLHMCHAYHRVRQPSVLHLCNTVRM
jgi:uncharacterized Rmd1/YagE family protein